MSLVGLLVVVVLSPVENEVVLVPALLKQVLEEPLDPLVVGLLLVLQGPHVVEVCAELDCVVLILLGRPLQSISTGQETLASFISWFYTSLF